MKKIFILILFSMLSLSIVISYNTIFEKVFAETSQSDITNTTNKIPDFSAKGTIDSVIYLVLNNTLTDPQDKVISLSNVTNGLNSSAKSLIDGNWTLDINKGQVKEFSANLSSINADASNYHTHILGNFTSNVNSQITTDPNNIINIKGKMDVGLNGETVWKQVNSNIHLYKNKTITITLDNKDTEDHFAQQQIYGKVKSFVT